MTVIKKPTTWQVLRNKFPEGEYVLMVEVSDAAGHSRSRSLDYMVVSLWQSRGLSVMGIEQKSNRGDWLKEIKSPDKQEEHFKYCDRFYLLTDREGVAKLDEIPDTWGWMHINEKGYLKIMKEAPKLNSQPIERSFMVAMLKRSAEKKSFVHIDSIEDKIESAVNKANTESARLMNNLQGEFDDLNDKVKKFEAAAGVRFGGWGPYDPAAIGTAVKYLNERGVDGLRGDLERMRDAAKKTISTIELAITKLKTDDQQSNTNNGGA